MHAEALRIQVALHCIFRIAHMRCMPKNTKRPLHLRRQITVSHAHRLFGTSIITMHARRACVINCHVPWTFAASRLRGRICIPTTTIYSDGNERKAKTVLERRKSEQKFVLRRALTHPLARSPARPSVRPRIRWCVYIDVRSRVL